MIPHLLNLYSAFNPSKGTYTAVNTHPEMWAADTAAPGEQLGVRCPAQGSHLCHGQGGAESSSGAGAQT